MTGEQHRNFRTTVKGEFYGLYRKVSQATAERYIRRFGGKITEGNNGCMRLLDIWLQQVAFFNPN